MLQEVKISRSYYYAPLVQWSLYKYKYLWGMGGKGQDLSLQEGVLHTYTLKLCFFFFFFVWKILSIFNTHTWGEGRKFFTHIFKLG